MKLPSLFHPCCNRLRVGDTIEYKYDKDTIRLRFDCIFRNYILASTIMNNDFYIYKENAKRIHKIHKGKLK